MLAHLFLVLTELAHQLLYLVLKSVQTPHTTTIQPLNGNAQLETVLSTLLGNSS